MLPGHADVVRTTQLDAGLAQPAVDNGSVADARDDTIMMQSGLIRLAAAAVALTLAGVGAAGHEEFQTPAPSTRAAGGGVATMGLDEDVPWAVAELSAALASITAGGSRWQGFFVAPGVVVTNASLLAGRAVVQLVAGSGRAGLGQVVATDAELDLAVLRVHADLTPSVVVGIDGRAVGRLPASAFLIRGGDGSTPPAERVQLGVSRDALGIRMVDVSPVPADDSVGAPCVDVEGRLLGVVARGDSSRPVRLAVLVDRIGALLNEARRVMETAETAVAASSRASSPPRPGRDGARPPSTAGEGADFESDTERARREGAEAFERATSGLARQRDEVVHLQARYDVECVGTYVLVVTIPGVGWPYPGEYLIEKSELPECMALRERVDGRAEAIRRALADAEEQARRAGVYPGTVRDIKRAHGLDAVR